LYGARKSGLKKEMFGFVDGGYKTVIEAFHKTLLNNGVNIKTNCAVNTVITNKNQKPEVVFSGNETQEFDEVILTLPSGVASKMCTGLSAAEIEKLDSVEYLGVICVAVLLDKSISDF